MAVRQDKVQITIDFITDESKQLAKAITGTDELRRNIVANQRAIAEYEKELKKTNLTEQERAEILKKQAIAERAVKDGMKEILASGKAVEGLDLSKITPAQLSQRLTQVKQLMRDIPQNSPEFAALRAEFLKLDAAQKQLLTTGAGFQKEGGLLQRILGVAGGLGVFELAKNAINSLVNFGRQALAEADAQLKADAQIKEAIRSTGGVAGKSLAELKQQAEELQKVTLFGDEQTEGAQALLLTFKNIRGEIFDETVPLVQDLATAFKQDLSSSAIQVGKALEDPVKGVTALRRVGITFSEDQRKMIKALVDTGDVAGAQRVILKELETQVGGSARAAAEAGAGPLQVLKNVFGELKEAVGGIVISLLRDFIPGIRSMVNAITEFLSVPVSEKLEEERQAFNGVSLSILNAEVGTKARTEAIKKLQQQYPQFLGNLDAEKVTNEQLKPILDQINQSYVIRIALQKQQEKLQPLLEAQAEQENRLAEGRAAANRLLARGAELAGINLEQFGTQAEQVQGVIAALNKTAQFQSAAGFDRPLNEQARVLNQIKGSLSQIDASSVRQRFATQQVTEAEQQRQEVIAELRNTYGELVDAATTFDGKSGGLTPALSQVEGDTATGKVKKEAEAAQGSLAFLRKQISDLQKELENTPGDSKALAPLVEQLKEAEQQLKELEARLERLKNPQGDIVPTDDEIRAQLGGFSQPDREPSEDERAAITEFNDFRVEDEEKTTEELNRFRQGLSDEDSARRQKERDEEAEHQKALKDLKLSAADSISNALFEIQRNQAQQETDEVLTALDKEYQAKIAAAEGNSALQSQLQKELEKKKEAIELEAARKRRALAIKEAVVAGALAVVKALPNPFAAIAAGIAATAQIAIISGQKFARGGFTGSGIGAPDETGYRPAGIVHEGEYVIPKNIVQNEAAAPVLRWLEGKRLRGYADGGLVTVNTTPTALPAVPVQATAALANMDMFVAAVAQFTATVAQFPTEVKSRVVVTELETAQAELAGVRADAAN